MFGQRERQRHTRRPELGQHFLRDSRLAAELVRCSTVGSEDVVLELGAGTGLLTTALARAAKRVVAVESDPWLADRLRRTWATSDRVAVRQADFTSFPLSSFEPCATKVVANLPFGGSARMVQRLTAGSAARRCAGDVPGAGRFAPSDVHVVLQQEAAERFAGYPYAPETLQSLLLKPWWHVEITRRLARRDFQPPPRVGSAFCWFAARGRPLIAPGEARAYERFVREAFGARGPSVADGLRRWASRRRVRAAGDELGFDADAPPSTVTFEQWLRLYRRLVQRPGERPRSASAGQGRS